MGHPARESRRISSQARRATEIARVPKTRILVWSELNESQLRRGARSGRLFEEFYRLTRVRDPEDQERRVGARLSSRVAVVDVNSLIAEPRRNTSELSRTISKRHLRDFGLAVISALAIQRRLGLVRIVHNETDGALALLVRELLIRDNVDVLLGESLAELAKRSRPVF